MTAAELMQQIYLADDPKGEFNRETCDTRKAGNPDREIKKVAIAMFGTPNILQEVAEWGAELLIVHEPMFFDHMDLERSTPVAQEKLRILEKNGLTVYRYHDYIHFREKDGIHAGFMKASGLQGSSKAYRHFTLDHSRRVLYTFAPAPLSYAVIKGGRILMPPLLRARSQSVPVPMWSRSD